MSALARLAVSITVLALCASGCSDDSTPPDSAVVSTSPSVSSSGTQQLSARERVAQLAMAAPRTFDATYRLDSKGKRPNADVRMRVIHDRFRLDIKRGSETSILISGAHGVISCQQESKGERPARGNCLLVSKNNRTIPRLFDPQLQRLFRNTMDALAHSHSDVHVSRAGTWQAPNHLGPAECFDVRGPDVENGTYCLLTRSGSNVGLLARAVFDSGSLNIRSVKHVVRPESFKPPTSPTPLPK